jgi:hypothetical protein
VTTLKQLWEKNDYAILFELKEAYNNIPVHPTMRPVGYRKNCTVLWGSFSILIMPLEFSQW